MLPRILYELLPYLYIIFGAVSVLLIDSGIILIASLLLMSAGALTIMMRRTYRDQVRNDGAVGQAAGLVRDIEQQSFGRRVEKRSGSDRRARLASGFPLIDGSGNVVKVDRRRQDRRQQFNPGFA